jgi:glycine/D-amino acid oxidase-like deaminating enzyme
LGEHLPLQAERGYHTFVPTDLRLNHSIMDADLRFVATPMNGGIRIAGLAEFAGNGRPPNWKFASALHELGRGMLPGLPDDRKCASGGWALGRACPILCRRSGALMRAVILFMLSDTGISDLRPRQKRPVS